MVPGWLPPSCAPWNHGFFCFLRVVSTSLTQSAELHWHPLSLTCSPIDNFSLAHIYALFLLYLKKLALNSVVFTKVQITTAYQQQLITICKPMSILSTLSLNLLRKSFFVCFLVLGVFLFFLFSEKWVARTNPSGPLWFQTGSQLHARLRVTVQTLISQLIGGCINVEKWGSVLKSRSLLWSLPQFASLIILMQREITFMRYCYLSKSLCWLLACSLISQMD